MVNALKEAQKRYYQNNKEKLNNYQKNYYSNNKEKVKEYNKNYYIKNVKKSKKKNLNENKNSNFKLKIINKKHIISFN